MFIAFRKELIGRSEVHGGGQVVRVLAFYSTIPVRIPLKSKIFGVKLLSKRTKINKKKPGLAH